MQVFSIYMATNKTNGKKYIGFDSKWPNRQRAHKNNCLNKNTFNYDCALHRAIRLYGWDAFEWEILYEHWDGQYTLNVLEPYFIDVYQSFGPDGYNMTKGGEGSFGCIPSEETKKKMRKPKDKKTRLKMSKAKLGIPKSEEHRHNMSLALKGNSNAKIKNCTLIDPQGNKHKISNLRKFCLNNSRLSYQCLIYVINGKQKQHKGWRLSDTF